MSWFAAEDQDDDVHVQAFVASFLLLDVRETETTAESLNEVGAFTRLVDLIGNPTSDEDAVLHRLLMELLYEMSRIQCIKRDDLRGCDSPPHQARADLQSMSTTLLSTAFSNSSRSFPLMLATHTITM